MTLNPEALLAGSTTAALIRQVGLLVGIAASVAVGVAVVMWSQTPNYGLLYGSLPERDVSQVMEVLQGSQIDFKIDPVTGAVMVPTSQVHAARMRLAGAGVPKSASIGFEMLDREQGFGTSQFMEQARYQRALEEELARSIAKLNNVRAARVHLALPKQSAFVRDKKEPSASVLVDLYSGRVLEDGQVEAIAHLVSAGVPNLQISAVIVVDQQGRLLTRPDESPEMLVTARRFDYTKRLEQSYVNRIEYILGPIVGVDGVKAQVTAELDFTATEQTSEIFHPDPPTVHGGAVLDEKPAVPGAGGIPGALSKTPSGGRASPEATRASAATAAVHHAGKQATGDYEVDKTISHSRMPVGTLRRLSVAVVVNNKRTIDASGQDARPEHTADDLGRISAVVKEAIGFNAARGDTVNVINADFTSPPSSGPFPEPALWERPWVWDMAKQLVGALFALGVVFGVLRPVMRNLVMRDAPARPTLPAAGAGDDAIALPSSGNKPISAAEPPAPTSGAVLAEVPPEALGEDQAGGISDRILQGRNGLESLKYMEPRRVAELIGDEHPQIIAVVLSYLDRDQAGAVLQEFPETRRADIVLRVAALDGVLPAAMQELNEILEKQLLRGGTHARSSNLGGFKAAAGLLNCVDGDTESSIMEKIKGIDRDLGQKIEDWRRSITKP